MKNYLSKIYDDRFDANITARKTLWKILCRYYFQRFIDPNDTVLDMAAGYCEFINHIEAKQKIAIDLNPKTKAHANKNVIVYKTSSTALPKKLTNKVDVVFVSNFFEHLDNKTELMETMNEIRRILKPGGRVFILQPNIRLVGGRYWDFVDHTLPLTEKTLQEVLAINKMQIVYQRVRFLPYTTSSRIPMIPLFVKLYLKFRPAQFVMGKQTFIIGRKGSYIGRHKNK